MSARLSGRTVCCTMLLFGACAAPAVPAQQNPNPFPAPDTPPRLSPAGDEALMLKRMDKERTVLRQKQIVADTGRLLELTRELSDDVRRSHEDQLSKTDEDKLAAIEKLAKNVKVKMRDGN